MTLTGLWIIQFARDWCARALHWRSLTNSRNCTLELFKEILSWFLFTDLKIIISVENTLMIRKSRKCTSGLICMIDEKDSFLYAWFPRCERSDDRVLGGNFATDTRDGIRDGKIRFVIPLVSQLSSLRVTVQNSIVEITWRKFRIILLLN